jgi:hypothetical protein
VEDGKYLLYSFGINKIDDKGIFTRPTGPPGPPGPTGDDLSETKEFFVPAPSLATPAAAGPVGQPSE